MKRWTVTVGALLLGGVLGTFVTAPLVLHGQPAAPPAAIPAEMTSYRDVVKKVLPAVVSIEARSKPAARPARQPRRDPDNFRNPEEFRKFLEEFGGRPDFGDEDARLGFGSGFLVDASGVILTNNHVVDGADQVEVTLQDGRKFTSRDVKADPKSDLAIVRIKSNAPLPFLAMGDSDAMEIGDRVLAVGAPFGLTGSVTSGIVSAKGRNLRMNTYEDFLQTDAAINPGNSGGPLVNLRGEVIAVNSAIKSRSGGFQGVGMSIASNLARTIMTDLQRDGVVHRGYLGVQVRDLEKDVASRLGAKPGEGVLAAMVLENGPAAKAGLKDGDVITTLNGKTITDGRVLQRVVAGLPVNKSVNLQVVRDGKPQTLQVVIEEQPKNFDTVRVPAVQGPRRQSEGVSVEKIGAEVADLNPDTTEQLGFKGKVEGVVVLSVEGNGLAAEAGLRRGQVIAKVDQQRVRSAAQFRELIDKASLAKGVLLQVQSAQAGTTFVLLKQDAT